MEQSPEQKTIYLIGELLYPVTNADGTGQQFEVAKEIFAQHGYQVKTSVYPYRRAVKLFENGHADMMIGMFKDENFQFNYSKYPHDTDNLLAIFPKKNEKNWQGVNSLANKEITFLAGLGQPFSQYLPSFSFQQNEVQTRKQAVYKLMHQRSDYMVDTEGSYLLAERLNITDDLVAKLIGYAEIYAAFADTPNGMRAKQLWDSSYPNFILTDKARSIYQKWGLEREYNVTKTYYQQLKLSTTE
ncbi:transporter substrate-binding domain-containing protein [Thalassotalea sp. G2M2-11]|uniref:transporter substrate-binding domain-containing protein n=1 Tax=Thalassotalea sp. G2M2-11 TaxID=2787627 RepID=UPI0019D07C95|nr:transporter substrate-binding domain-containing protein [Thalassotalea sp. G2M2-11]